MQSYISLQHKKGGGGKVFTPKLDKLQLSEEKPVITEILKKEDSRIKRARAKWVNLPKIKALLKYAVSQGDCSKGYERAKNCCNMIISKGGKLVSSYCFERSCLQCNRIKTGKLINRYQKDFELMKEPYFITLTIPNIEEKEVKDELKYMKRQIRKIADLGRKKGIYLKGIRKLEITYNRKRNDYHPHYHFLIDGEIEARFLLDNWLKKNPMAYRKAQDIQKADEKSLKELFKYSVKEQDSKDIIPIENLHFIYKVLKGERTFQSMGNFAPKIEEIESENPSELVAQEKAERDNQIFLWFDKIGDWIDKETGELYSGYLPSEKDKLKRYKYEKLHSLSG